MSRHKSFRVFSVCFAEELLRAELRCLYGEAIQFYQAEVSAPSVSHAPNSRRMDLSINERSFYHEAFRVVEIEAIIGQFAQSSGKSITDNRSALYRVSAKIRLFGADHGALYWYPHYAIFTVYEAHENVGRLYNRFYIGGTIDGVFVQANAENPCGVMFASQTSATYAKLHGLAKPR